MKRGDQQSDFPPGEHPSGGTSRSRPEPQNNGTPDDPALLEAALRGDIDAFADLFEGYRQRLHALCLKRLSDRSLAEDIVQEVFVRGLINLPSFDRRKQVWPWLATIAVRMCIDLQRRRSFTHYSEDIGSTIEADTNRIAPHEEADSALDTVIAAEGRAELFKSLGILPKRQRRVFLLYALDGWSCSDIAAAEGISVGAVHLLLFRARRKMRSLREDRPLPTIVLPFTWLNWKVRQTAERIRSFLGVHGEGLSSVCAQAICLGTVAMMAVATGNLVKSSDDNDATRSDENVLSAVQSQPLQAAWLQAALPNVGTPAKTPVESQRSPSVVDPASSLVDEVINPNQNATPEETILHSIMASPNYESDHTILAAGIFKRNRVLFVSNDGGGSWKPRPSRLLDGSTLVLPPDFPQDGRMFTFGGNLGLQQSDDGGEIFRLVSPVLGRGLAISPSFGREDSKILMGGRTIFEFDAGTGVTQPALLTIPPAQWGGYYPSVVFSPSYQSDSTVFVSERNATYRCKGSVCEEIPLPTPGPLRFRFSPRFGQDGLAYAFTPWKPLFSNDGTKTFGETQYPIEVQPSSVSGAYIHDVAIAWHTFSNPAIFASVAEFSSSSRYPSGIYRSLDAGRSWNMTSIGIPGFGIPGYGLGAAHKLIVTPTGRLLATGTGGGIACSVDKGQTWARRCPPEL